MPWMRIGWWLRGIASVAYPSVPSTPSVAPVGHGIWVTCMAAVVVNLSPATLMAVVAESTTVLDRTFRQDAASPTFGSSRSVPEPTET